MEVKRLKSFLNKDNQRFLIELSLYSLFLIVLVYINKHVIMNKIAFQLDELDYVLLHERMNPNKWAYLTSLANLFLRCFGGALCLSIGGVFNEKFSKLKYFTSCRLLVRVQWLLVLVLVFVYVSFWIKNDVITIQSDLSLGNSRIVSMLFGTNSTYKYPISFLLQSINLFQLLYLMLLAISVRKETSNKYIPSFLFVLKTYGVGYLIFNVLVSFVMLIYLP